MVSNFTIPGEDHFFVFKNKEIFNEQLLSELEALEGEVISVFDDEEEDKEDSAISTTVVSSILMMASYITVSVL